MRGSYIQFIALLTLTLLCWGRFDAIAQSRKSNRPKTNKTTNEVKDWQGENEDRKNKKYLHLSPDYKYIYKKKGSKLLIGNPCAVSVTHKYGFVYQLHHRKESLGRELSRITHNFGVQFGLIFTKSPFWKTKVKREFKNCARVSGDYRG
ncbi:hypothetical protein [Reichenbachiella versicolor]|uniref:hypothetical protein n=1 Tax=Reichenbachiella versicolor TaxID=1821036 RepID=UPI000D6E4620|nr:hypothetical protein [Reichenbachiella versicolor]